MGRIIGICSAKGGVGKTTVAINLAITLSKFFNKKVLLIDFNLTAPHISLYLGVVPQRKLNEVLRGEIGIEKSFEDYFYGIKLSLASDKLEDLIGNDLGLLRKELEKVKNEFDFIILDLAPGIGREAANGILSSEELILVTTPLIPAFSDIARVKKIAEELNKNILGVVLNQWMNKSYEIKEKEIESLGLKVISKIPFHSKFRESINTKTPIMINKRIPKEIQNAFIKTASYLTGEYVRNKESFIDKIKKFFGI